ncbi:hypothetical protein CHELA1G11_20478 [Hyphomicrobiales bacterium]|nr:hypothetical protein CHELA1G11_20478 [Hyphomicrobiales bacterium]CAH1690416.1 hypothetical protein CHELA1G2_20791 [Hyphomicrobiales bacterium]
MVARAVSHVASLGRRDIRATSGFRHIISSRQTKSDLSLRQAAAAMNPSELFTQNHAFDIKLMRPPGSVSTNWHSV